MIKEKEAPNEVLEIKKHGLKTKTAHPSELLDWAYNGKMSK